MLQSTKKSIAYFQQNLKELVVSYLGELGVTFVSDAFKECFFDDCCESMSTRGWSDQTTAALRPFIPGGVVMACTAYSHLSNKSTRILIALYTAILIYLD